MCRAPCNVTRERAIKGVWVRLWGVRGMKGMKAQRPSVGVRDLGRTQISG
ncbi:hypothetical protein DUNSADRAFT_4172 [Dunaliella salina]|uniref:Encoded protein n=1 Tax=Dunaliella salina TaxID=3046 RepID=A0ABQ7GSN8_DUNSA|nr:hypothetical protein DUNSADRAFT_4172 [Dunaliella salina]|eukprot:KAF5837601.1 hypothetical protein DUNSADRAFT_4172 [Dunaliella salina]